MNTFSFAGAYHTSEPAEPHGSETTHLHAYLDQYAAIQEELIFQQNIADRCKTLLYHRNVDAIYGKRTIQRTRINALLKARQLKKQIADLNSIIEEIEAVGEVTPC